MELQGKVGGALVVEMGPVVGEGAVTEGAGRSSVARRVALGV